MEENQQNNSDQNNNNQIVIKVPSKSELIKSKWLSPSTLVLICIFFFFTFCDVSCSRQVVTSIKGFDFIFGKTITSSLTGTVQTVPSSFWAILAFISSLFGLSLIYRKLKFLDYYLFITSIVGFISLIILQIVIVSKVNKSGEGQIEVNFQFAYWAAIFLFLVNVILSYLRFKDDSSKKPSLKQIIENINENKYIKYSVIVVIVICLFLLFNSLFFKNPNRLGHSIASDYNECQNNYTNALIDKYNIFITNFDQQKFIKRQQARNYVDSLTQICENLKNECTLKVDNKVSKIKQEFSSDPEKFNEFKNAYSLEIGHTDNEASSKLDKLKQQAENKISTIIDPEPDSEKVKHDIIGQVISFWRFANISEFKSFKIETSTKTDRYLNLLCYTDLQDMNNNKEYKALLNIRYVYNSGEWNFNKITEVFYGDKS